MKKTKKIQVALLSSMLLFGSSYLNQTTTYAQASQQASLQTFYVTEGNGEAGDGSQGNPFKGLLAALNALPAQQKVKLVLQNHLVVTANELQLSKNVEIDGQGMSITVRSSKVVVSEPTTLKNVNFKMVRDGTIEPEIIVRDTLLLMDDVSTLVSDGQQTERPTIVIERTKPLATPTAFVVKGNNAESKFKKITSRDNDTTSKAIVVITNPETEILDSVELKGNAEISSSANKVKKIVGTNDNNKVTFGDVNINNAELNGVSEIVLADNATVRMSTDTAPLQFTIPSLAISQNSHFVINSPTIEDEKEVTINRLVGNGKLTINLNVNKTIQDQATFTGTIDDKQNPAPQDPGTQPNPDNNGGLVGDNAPAEPGTEPAPTEPTVPENDPIQPAPINPGEVPVPAPNDPQPDNGPTTPTEPTVPENDPIQPTPINPGEVPVPAPNDPQPDNGPTTPTEPTVPENDPIQPAPINPGEVPVPAPNEPQPDNGSTPSQPEVQPTPQPLPTPPVDTPKEPTPPVDTPKEPTPPVDTPKESTPPVDTPKEPTPPVDTPKESTPPVDTPKKPSLEKQPTPDKGSTPSQPEVQPKQPKVEVPNEKKDVPIQTVPESKNEKVKPPVSTSDNTISYFMTAMIALIGTVIFRNKKKKD